MGFHCLTLLKVGTRILLLIEQRILRKDMEWGINSPTRNHTLGNEVLPVGEIRYSASIVPFFRPKLIEICPTVKNVGKMRESRGIALGKISG